MKAPVADQQNIPVLIAAMLLLIILLVIGFGIYLDDRMLELHVVISPGRAQEMQMLVRGFLGLFVLVCIVSGMILIRKINRIVEQGRITASRLLESEERMKLALSGANEGTWDLDVASGKLNFDTGWGRLLGYAENRERPQYLADWSRLIHEDDRERVIGIMQYHIAGELPEYKAEYRIRSKSGQMIWVAGHGRAVSRDARGRALRIVGVTRDITQKKEFENTIWRLAHFDHLTGLPNRILLEDRLEQCIHQAVRYNKMLAVFYMDLDGFKQVNDTLGHEGGDELLQKVSARLGALLRSTDTVARMGGDEFILLMNELQHRDDAALLAHKIISSIGIPFTIQNSECVIGCSVGIAFFPDDGTDAASLIARADDAMYRAKAGGKNTFKFAPARVS